MIDPNAVADRIWDLEFATIKSLSGHDVRIENVRVNRKRKYVLADVVFHDYDDEAERTDRYPNCCYSFRQLGL